MAYISEFDPIPNVGPPENVLVQWTRTCAPSGILGGVIELCTGKRKRALTSLTVQALNIGERQSEPQERLRVSCVRLHGLIQLHRIVGPVQSGCISATS